jgi:hypothetical protein
MSRFRATLNGLFRALQIFSGLVATIIFFPGYAIRVSGQILAGRLQGGRIRTQTHGDLPWTTPYNSGGSPISWSRLVRFVFGLQLGIGVVLLLPFCIQAAGDPAYLLPVSIRDPAQLLLNEERFEVLGAFSSRFAEGEFLQYWIGVSALVAIIPDRRARRLASAEAAGSTRRRRVPLLTTLNIASAVDDRIGALGLNSYAVAGVAFAALVIICLTWICHALLSLF